MRGRVSLRGRRARASEGRLFVCFETGRRRDARLWLRGFAGLSIRDPCFERPPSRRRRALEGPVRVCSPGVVATVARAAVLGERRVTSRRRHARSTARSASTPAGAPDGRVTGKRLSAAAPLEDVAGVLALVYNQWDSATASTRRRRGASVGRSVWLRRSRRRRMRRWVVTVTVLFFSQWIHRSRLCLTRERESLRREAKAQSVPKSGPYTSSLACAYAVNITTRRKPVLTHVHPPRTARDALRRPRDGRLAVICNSPATCDDRGAAAGYRCKRCVEGVLSCRVTARSGRTSAVAHCSAAAET